MEDDQEYGPQTNHGLFQPAIRGVQDHDLLLPGQIHRMSSEVRHPLFFGLDQPPASFPEGFLVSAWLFGADQPQEPPQSDPLQEVLAVLWQDGVAHRVHLHLQLLWREFPEQLPPDLLPVWQPLHYPEVGQGRRSIRWDCGHCEGCHGSREEGRKGGRRNKLDRFWLGWKGPVTGKDRKGSAPSSLATTGWSATPPSGGTIKNCHLWRWRRHIQKWRSEIKWTSLSYWMMWWFLQMKGGWDRNRGATE